MFFVGGGSRIRPLISVRAVRHYVVPRSQMVKHSKDLLEVVGDTERLLARLHIY